MVMETSIINTQAVSTATNITDISSNKKADCYFYYYSSCNKGNACPFRHEPAALMNETMCLYWLKGNCNKPHCIYRHMEITKKRDKIQCFFESQPGGCKKLHCPFLHNNVLDRPREEDVPNKPGLILPVKDSEAEYESETKKLQDSVAAQLKLQRKLSQSSSVSKDDEKEIEIPLPSITRRSFIVPLQDGESDSESINVSPIKTARPETWELERLREIQKEEGNLLGYSFTSEDQDDLQDQEFSDEEDQDAGQIIIKREIPKSERITDEPDNYQHKGYIKRILDGVLKKKTAGDSLSRNITMYSSSDPSSESDGHVVIFNRSSFKEGLKGALTERLGPKAHPNGTKMSVKDRLGKRKILDSENEHEDGHRFSRGDESVLKKRLGTKDDGMKSLLTPKETTVKSRLTMKESVESIEGSKQNIVVKSLSDIRAEKERLKQGNQSKDVIKPPSECLPLSAFISDTKDWDKEAVADVQNIKIKTLAEIKAEKGKSSTSPKAKQLNSFKESNKLPKRPISPIRFDHFNKKPKPSSNSDLRSTQKEIMKVEPTPKENIGKVESTPPKKIGKVEPTPPKKIRKVEPTPPKKIGKVEPTPKEKIGKVEPTPKEISKVQRIESPRKLKLKRPIRSGSVNKKRQTSILRPTVSSNSPSSTPSIAREDIPSPNETRLQERMGERDKNALESTRKSTSREPRDETGPRQNVSRLDSLVDEEELLLQGDVLLPFDDEEIDEDALLL